MKTTSWLILSPTQNKVQSCKSLLNGRNQFNTIIHSTKKQPIRLVTKRKRANLSVEDKYTSFNSQSNSKYQTIAMSNHETNKYSFIPKMQIYKNLSAEIIDSILILDESQQQYKQPNLKTNLNNMNTINTINKNTTNNNKRRKIVFKPRAAISSPQNELPLKIMNYSINQMFFAKSNKLIKANLTKSKHNMLFKSRNSIMTKNVIKIIKTNHHSSMKVGSMMDRFLLKLINPDDFIEDYVSGNYGIDKYKRFKTSLTKEKERIYKIFSDNKQSQQINNQILKLYTSKLRTKKYTSA